MPDNSNRLAWHHFTFDLPPDWEITAYSTSAREGRFELNTREGFQGQVSWEKCKREPDQVRMMSELHVRDLRENDPEKSVNFKELSLENAGKFRVGYGDAGNVCQASLYLDEKSILLRWVFPGFSKKKLKSVIKPLLESFGENSDEWAEWGFYGLRFMLPRDFEIEVVGAMPGDIALTLESRRPMRVSAHRWGLPSLMLEGTTLKGFYSRFLKNSRCRIDSLEETALFEKEAVKARYRQSGMKGMNKLYGADWKGTGYIWHDKEEQRIYACEQVAPKKVPPLEIKDVFLFS